MLLLILARYKIKEHFRPQLYPTEQSSKCIHSANCVKYLSSVFQPQTQPWIKLDNATTEEIVSTVAECPSGALSIKKTE